MNGIENLNELLKSLEPELHTEEFVFCTFPHESLSDKMYLSPISSFQEKEGLTLIITKECAIANSIPFESVFSLISLTIHSSLDAVGLTAAIAGKLASKNISANVVAAYYHDHIFVQKEKAKEAIKALKELQQESMN
ncbi:ACT domain-containing protein [Prevotella sp. 10(H)]|uniref:ACT domain-containing protein n=1 Tax=Prevotella sp. 10(H) TaxID=1158294 RepID=UPI0004A72041|nr:ACT domain-containing protein [Prevotella sp. 10(H)]